MASQPPLPVNSFRVTIGGQSAAFTEVTGLSIARDTVTYVHGFSHWEGETLITYPSNKHQQITLRHGVFAGDGSFYDWLVGADGEARPMSISLLDGSGTPRVTWRVKAAVPTKMTGPTFSAASGDAAIDSLDVQIAGVSVEQGG